MRRIEKYTGGVKMNDYVNREKYAKTLEHILNMNAKRPEVPNTYQMKFGVNRTKEKYLIKLIIMKPEQAKK